jgi:hypothetical protein
MKNMVVFGGRLDETNRRTLEDAFVSALENHGVRATASYRMFPGALPSTEVAQSAMHKAGVDGALVSSMRGTSEKTRFVPGTYSGDFWYGYYGPGWGGVLDPGYVVTDEFVNFETSLWDTRGNGKLVWSAVTQTKNPKSARDFASSLVRDVVRALATAGFLPVADQGNAVPYAGTNASRAGMSGAP